MKAVYQAISIGFVVAGLGLIIFLLLLIISGRLFLPATAGVGIAGVICILIGYLARQAGK